MFFLDEVSYFTSILSIFSLFYILHSRFRLSILCSRYLIMQYFASSIICNFDILLSINCVRYFAILQFAFRYFAMNALKHPFPSGAGLRGLLNKFCFEKRHLIHCNKLFLFTMLGWNMTSLLFSGSCNQERQYLIWKLLSLWNEIHQTFEIRQCIVGPYMADKLPSLCNRQQADYGWRCLGFPSPFPLIGTCTPLSAAGEFTSRSDLRGREAVSVPWAVTS